MTVDNTDGELFWLKYYAKGFLYTSPANAKI